MKKFTDKYIVSGRLTHITAVIALFAVGCMLVYLTLNNNLNEQRYREEPSHRIIEARDCDIQQDATAPAGVKKVYTINMPQDMEWDTHLCIYTVHRHTKVYIDDVLVYSIEDDENTFMETIGTRWIWVPVKQEEANSDIKVEMAPAYENGIKRERVFYMGAPVSLLRGIIKEEFPALIICSAAIFAGTIFVGLATYFNKKHKGGKELFFMGLFSICIGLWKMTDTRAMPAIFADSTTLLFYISIMVLMIGPLTIVQSLKRTSSRSGVIQLETICIIANLSTIIQIILQVIGLTDLRENLHITHFIIVLSVIVVITNAMIEAFQKKNESAGGPRKLYVICVTGVLIDLIVFYITGSSSELFFSIISFVAYMVFNGIFLMLHYAQRGKRLKEQELMMVQSQISTMISQIQPHFLYNSIGAIQALCNTNPQAASEALGDFADYLRGNVDSINSRKPIHFLKELAHTESYLNLEKMRFGEKLNVEYDIQEKNFFLPALTIQPIIENAVKHGKADRDDFRIILRTFRKDDKIIIEIEDNGIGFDMDAVAEKKNSSSRTHIGMESVKVRLNRMVKGNLIMHSEPGKGTTATIILNNTEI